MPAQNRMVGQHRSRLNQAHPPHHPSPSLTDDPTVAEAAPAAWYRWFRQLLVGARLRLAEVSAALVVVLLACAGGLWVFGEIADEVSEGQTRALDYGVWAFLRQYESPSLSMAMTAISYMGSEILAAILVASVAWLIWSRHWGSAISLLLVVGGAALLNSVLKDHFQRPRPVPFSPTLAGLAMGQEWSFPSGHAMVSAAFYLFVAYLTWHLLYGWMRLVWTGAIFALVLLIGLSRLYLGVHYLTDVAAGYAAGMVWTGSVILAGRFLAYRRWTREEQRRASEVAPTDLEEEMEEMDQRQAVG
jgi:membrane-associated phospholipid phosphatase